MTTLNLLHETFTLFCVLLTYTALGHFCCNFRWCFLHYEYFMKTQLNWTQVIPVWTLAAILDSYWKHLGLL